MTLRWARSPVPPNRTRTDGSGTRSRRRPSRRTFSGTFDRDDLRPWRANRMSSIVRGASLALGAGRAGIGWSGGASRGAVSTLGTFSTTVAVFAPLVRVDATVRYSVLTA